MLTVWRHKLDLAGSSPLSVCSVCTSQPVSMLKVKFLILFCQVVLLVFKAFQRITEPYIEAVRQLFKRLIMRLLWCDDDTHYQFEAESRWSSCGLKTLPQLKKLRSCFFFSTFKHVALQALAKVLPDGLWVLSAKNCLWKFQLFWHVKSHYFLQL